MTEREEGNHKLKHRKFHLNMHWPRLPREVVESPSL